MNTEVVTSAARCAGGIEVPRDKNMSGGIMEHASAMRSIASLLLTVALFSASAASHAQSAASVQVVRFNIGAQAMKDALKALANQSDIQIIFTPSSVKELTTDGVRGEMTTDQALGLLLKGTGLEHEREGDVVVVRERAPKASAQDSSHPNISAAYYASDRIRLAQATDKVPGGSLARDDQNTPGNDRRPQSGDDKPLAEVIVTGSHIRNVNPVGTQLLAFDRDYIDKTGLATAQDFMQTLPQNFGGGVSEDARLGLEASTNAARSTAVNLRGLGAGATLVLLNGRRFAPAGTEGTFTDISNIPLTAIDRIEVLPDGASAIYGSEAVGGVVNFILREDYDGAETTVRYGSATEGTRDDLQIAQALGQYWNSGRGLLSYEFYHRDALPAAERELAASSDLRPLGGANFDNAFDNPGTIVIGTQTWAIPTGQDGTSLTPGDLIAGTANVGNRNEGRDLLPEHERNSVLGSVQQDIGDRVELFADALFSQREIRADQLALTSNLSVPNTNPHYINPTGGMGPVRVAYSFKDDLGSNLLVVDVTTYNGGLGAKVDLAGNWRATIQGGYGQEDVEQWSGGLNTAAVRAALADPNPATALNPFADGSFTNPATLAAIRASTFFSTDSDVWMANASVDGSVWRLGGGDVRLAIGSEYREYEFASLNQAPGLGAADVRSSFNREIIAAYAELFVPLFASGNARPGLQRLELSLAGRYEDYSDYGDTVVPKVGLTWSPVAGLSLRGTWSESFKAPNLADLDESRNTTIILPVADPLSATGTSPTLLWTGKNASLVEETADTWSAGIQFVPPNVRGLVLDLSYFDIEFQDRIDAAPFTFTWLTEPRFAAVVTRAPTSEQRDLACSSSTFSGVNPSDCRNAPVAALVDLRTNNTAVTKTSGIDLQASYAVESSVGGLGFDLSATYLLEFAQAQFQSSPLLELLDTVNNPIDFHARGSLSWQRSGFGSTLFVNYTHGYTDTVSEPDRIITSWTTLDLQMGYATGNRSGGMLDDILVSLNVQNLLDKDPPFFNNPFGVGYDQENADVLGRVVSLQLRKSW